MFLIYAGRRLAVSAADPRSGRLNTRLNDVSYLE